MYTIGQVSEMFHLPVSTLRYYDKEGLFPNLKRESGIRKFNDHELEALRMIECLKASGLEIKGIKQFFEWCNQGSSTYQNETKTRSARCSRTTSRKTSSSYTTTATNNYHVRRI